jgi:hypothetical protein
MSIAFFIILARSNKRGIKLGLAKKNLLLGGSKPAGEGL